MIVRFNRCPLPLKTLHISPGLFEKKPYAFSVSRYPYRRVRLYAKLGGTSYHLGKFCNASQYYQFAIQINKKAFTEVDLQQLTECEKQLRPMNG